MKLFALTLGLLVASSANSESLTLIGDSIDAAMIRTIDTGYGTGRILGYGLDGPFTVAEGTSDQRQYSSHFTLNVDGGKFDLHFLSTAGWQDGIVFRLSNLDFSSPGTSFLSSLAINTNLIGYSVTIGTHSVDIGLGGTHFTPTTYFTGIFGVSAVPEPETYAMLLAGLGLMGFAARRKPSA